MTLKEILTPRGFLTVGGIALLLVAVLSFLHIIGPTPDNSIFGAAWYFDGAENVAHLVLGVVALVAILFIKDKGIHKFLVVAVGALAVFAGLMSLMGPITEGTNILGAQLQNPGDTILYLVIGAWGLYAGLMVKPAKKK